VTAGTFVSMIFNVESIRDVRHWPIAGENVLRVCI